MSAAPLPTLAEAGRRIAAGEVSPVALTEAALARAEALQPRLDAFIEIAAERARTAARRAEREIKGGRRRGPLHGIPYGLKDIYDAAGLRTTAHSRLLLDNVAATDAETTARLEAAGMILIGKLATHEFGAQPMEHQPFHRRVEFGLGCGGRGWDRVAGDGIGYRRLDPLAGGLLRHGRVEADLRPGQPPRGRAAMLQPRYHRAPDLDGRRRGAVTASTRWI
jgi:amidase